MSVEAGDYDLTMGEEFHILTKTFVNNLNISFAVSLSPYWWEI